MAFLATQSNDVASRLNVENYKSCQIWLEYFVLYQACLHHLECLTISLLNAYIELSFLIHFLHIQFYQKQSVFIQDHSG